MMTMLMLMPMLMTTLHFLLAVAPCRVYLQPASDVAGSPIGFPPAQGDQFDRDYLKINPNNKVPTIVDHQSADGEPMSVFESGAILLYLGEKVDQFLGGPPGSRSRHLVMQWLMFQMASVGPHFEPKP